MKFLENYYSQQQGEQMSVSAQQGSVFAKSVAGDFNPIHDADSKRFCVPGDLLFAIVLSRIGLYAEMRFEFLGLVAADKTLTIPTHQDSNERQEIVNARGKPVLGIEHSGAHTLRTQSLENVARSYVAFSGQNFPFILVPLMREQGVMMNPQKPLVIYKRMSFHLDELDSDKLDLRLAHTQLEVDGKRGRAELNFEFIGDDRVVGSGQKILILSGLRDYDEDAIKALCDELERRKSAYANKPLSG